MKTWAKALIIIAVIASGTISLLLAPLVPVTNGMLITDEIINQLKPLNLVANVDAANILIQYANDSSADAINVTWDVTVRHSILVPPPTIVVSWDNYTISDELNVNLTIDFEGLLLASGLLAIVIVTINPLLYGNFSITTTAGNINLTNTNHLNPVFIDVNLTSNTGNIYASFISNSEMWNGDLRVQSTTGNCEILFDPINPDSYYSIWSSCRYFSERVYIWWRVL